MKRCVPYEPPEGPLEPRPPLSTERWIWTVVTVLLLLAAIGELAG
jgi:hypothetical protein